LLRPAFMSLLVLLLALIGGCVNDTHCSPQLPAQLVHVEQGLVGAFAGDEGSVSFEEIRVPVDQETMSLDPRSRHVHDAGEHHRSPAGLEYKTAYRIRLQLEDDFEGTLYGYVVELNDRRYLGVNVSLEQLMEGLGFPFLLPTFTLFPYELNEDELTFWSLRDLVLLLVSWDAEPAKTPPVYIVGSEAGRDEDPEAMSVRVVFTVDQLLEHYRAEANKPEFLQEEPLVFRRAGR